MKSLYGLENGHHLPRGKWSKARVWENKEHFQDFKKFGEIVVPKLWLPDFNNGITDVGIHYLLEAGFRGGSAISTWYAGVIDNAGYTGVAAGDTMASHTGWTEINANYNEATRRTLSFGAAASRAITAEVSFTFNASKTAKGLFVTSVNTKGGTTGTLWSTALFASPPALVNGNVLTANYTLSD